MPNIHHVHPKFSIITVTYNAGSVLEDTIQSVITQTYKKVEYIIVDGGSKDHTLDIIHKYREHIHTLVSEPDKGLYDAMNMDIGGGTTDIAVISLGGIVESTSIKIAGDQFDEAIIKYIRRKHNVLIGERTAEEIKMQIGCVFPRPEEQTFEVKGRCLMTGLPRVFTVTSSEMIEAFEEVSTRILEAIHGVLERTPPELVADISTNGIVMTGGGSLVWGFDKLIESHTGIETYVAEDAISCVAYGTGKSLEWVGEMQDGTMNISRRKQMN